MQDINLIRNDIDTYRIVTEIDSLLADITEFKDQICLQGISKDMNPFYGSRRIDEMDHKETDFKHFLFPKLGIVWVPEFHEDLDNDYDGFVSQKE